MHFRDSILQIEPTDHCNLKCVMCAPQRDQGDRIHGQKPKGFLDFGLFERIMASIEQHNIYYESLLMHWIGEPFLHKEYLNMLKHVLANNAANFGCIRSDTNFNTVSKQTVDELLSFATAQLQITFSLDATTAETYSKIRVGGDYTTVISNVHYLIEERRRLRKSGPTLNFQLVVQEANAHQVRDFVDYWSEYLIGRSLTGDLISIMRKSVGTGGTDQQRSDELYDSVIARSGLRSKSHHGVGIYIMENTSWSGQNE